jgi:hypothetical protein
VLRPSTSGQPLARFSNKCWNQDRGTLAEAARLDVPLPAVSKPERLLLRAELRSGGQVHRNEWPLWLVPGPAPEPRLSAMHPSMPTTLAAELFPRSKAWAASDRDAVVVTCRFDDDLVTFLERGGRVLMLPDGQRGSLPVSSHWFLRGAPWIAGHPLNRSIPRELFVELQHFDLAAGIVPNPPYLEDIDPILMLWDTHDLRTIKTHGLVFETRAGAGRLLVSALRHDGANAAGRWLLRELLDHLATGPAPAHALPPDLWQQLKEKLHEEKIALTDREWRLRPDPRNEGVESQWFRADLAEDDTWKPVRVGAHWESQGFPSLDGWAWYRIRVPVPASW